MHVVTQWQRLQGVEQACPQVEHHALPGDDHHLRVHGRDELVEHLQDEPGGNDDEDQPHPAVAADARRMPLDPRRERLPADGIVDDRLQRPGREHPEGDLDEREQRIRHDQPAVGAKERQRPRQ